jgi:TRAP-type C4-dicarboxylate transport system permease small subunit
MKRLLIILDKTMEGMTFLAGLLLVFIMLAVCLDVILRTFFEVPQLWVTEVTEVLLLYITFLTSAWLLREEGHVRVDILLNRLEPRTVAFLGIVSSLVGVLVSLVLAVFGTAVTWDYYQRGVYTPSVMEFPVWLILLVIPLGSAALLFQFVRRGIRSVGGFLIETSKAERGS